MTYFLHTNGIEKTTIVPNKPKYKSSAERITNSLVPWVGLVGNLNLLNVERSAFTNIKLPKTYWKFTILYETYKYNRIPHSITKYTHVFQLTHQHITSTPINTIRAKCTVINSYANKMKIDGVRVRVRDHCDLFIPLMHIFLK